MSNGPELSLFLGVSTFFLQRRSPHLLKVLRGILEMPNILLIDSYDSFTFKYGGQSMFCTFVAY